MHGQFRGQHQACFGSVLDTLFILRFDPCLSLSLFAKHSSVWWLERKGLGINSIKSYIVLLFFSFPLLLPKLSKGHFLKKKKKKSFLYIIPSLKLVILGIGVPIR